MIRLLLGAIAAFTLASLSAPSRADEPAPSFKPASCAPGDVPPEIAARLRCGTLAVPRDYASPEAGTYSLSVRVLTAPTPSEKAAAILLIAGAPGDPGLPAATLHELAASFPDRDLVTFDTRGTGASQPSACADLNPFASRFIASTFDAAGFHAAFGNAVKACLSEAEAAGIASTAFGTSTSAEDANLVRQSLGYAKLDVIGTGYGAATALDLAAHHPEAISSLTLNSPYIGTSSPLSGPENWARARMAIFAECERDASCIAAYPDLAAELDRLLASLRERPLAVPVPPVFAAPGNVVQLDAIDFEALLFDMAADRNSAALIPAIVRATGQGRTSALTDLLATRMDDARRSGGLASVAVPCRDGVALHEASRLGPTAADGTAVSYGLLSSYCGTWAGNEPTPTLPTEARFPVITLSGLIDPQTPPANARTIAYFLGAVVRQFEFPSIGHDVLAQSGCARQIAGQFVANPTGPLAWSCAREQSPVQFRPPSL